MNRAWHTRTRHIVAVSLLVSLSLLAAVVQAEVEPNTVPRSTDVARFEAGRKKVALPDGETLSYVTVGVPSGHPVVFIHGFTDNAEDWVPLLPYLSDKYYLILVDQRGHGSSSAPECCYTRFDFAYDVKLLLDELHVAKADVVGHSLGSIVTQTLAEFWPERVERVVLIGSTGGQRPGIKQVPQKFDLQGSVAKLKDPIDPDSQFMVDWFSSPHAVVDSDWLRKMRQRGAAVPVRVWLAVMNQAVPDDLQRTLPKLKAPALLIWGQDDPLMLEDARQSLRQALPQAKVKIYPGLGHQPFWEVPKEVADDINSFLVTSAR